MEKLMVQKWKITIPQLTGNQTRNAYLYLPESYFSDDGRRYPVLYMFDGHNVFFDSDATYGKSWGMKEYMDQTDTQLLIAAVECSHSPDHGRLSEYAPFSFSAPEIGEITGRGKLTMEWLTQSFKPYIDSHFRTRRTREHTFIAGSSMGGLMSIYALLEYNCVFSKAAALSPSLWVSPKQVEQMVRRAKPTKDTVLYMDYGSLEIKNSMKILRQFADIASLLTKRRILLTSRIVPGGEHCEASWEKQIPFFMNTLLYPL